MKIAFHDNILSVRGTTVAIFDYVYWCRQLFGIESIVLYNTTYPQNEKEGYDKCASEFPVFGYSDKSQIDNILSNEKCDKFFVIKSGQYDGIVSNVCENLIMAVGGNITRNDIHGDKYAVCSTWLSRITHIPCVPHMINLPDIDEDLRDDLKIGRAHV